MVELQPKLKMSVEVKEKNSDSVTAEDVSLAHFTQETSLHGVRYLTSVSSKVRKVAWGSLLLSVSVFCLYFSADTVYRYMKHDSYFSSKVTPPKTVLSYPAVSICNTHFFKNEALKNYSDVLYSLMTDFFNFKIDETTIPQLAALHIVDSTNQSSFSINETFVQCGIGRGRTFPNCEKFVTRFFTLKGMCFTFNGRNAAERLDARAPGVDQSITLTLDLNTYAGLSALKNTDAISVVIHDPDDFPDFDTTAFLLRPGTATEIAMKKSVKEMLGKPYVVVSCIEEETIRDQKLEEFMAYHGMPYSQHLCYEDCRMHKILFEDSCRIMYQGEQACTFMSFLNMMGAQIYNQLAEGNISITDVCSNCLPNCTKNYFTTKTSFGDYPNQERLYSLTMLRPQYDMTGIKENLLELKLYYETLEVTEIHQTPAIPPSVLYSNIGGLMGLFLGASFITIAEFLDFLFMCIKKKMPKKANVTRVQAFTTSTN